MIQLKRFKNDGNFKVENYVDIPIKDLTLSTDNFKETYDLVAVINHFGSICFGHYIAICYNHYNKKWYKYDDTVVNEVDEKKIITNHAYILFFKNKGFTISDPDKFYAELNRNIEEIKNNFQKLSLRKMSFKE